jgi:uncharacterized protein (TIGR02001 family)
MNKKILSILLGACTVGVLAIQAQTTAPVTTTTTSATTTPAPATVATPAPAPAAPDAWSVVVTPSYVSSYMFRGSRLGGDSFQPSIEADYGSSIKVGIWNSEPISNSAKVHGQSDPEIDPYGSYTFAINDSLSIQPGATWYNYPQAPTNEGFYKSTFEPSLAVNYTFSGVTLSPTYYYDVILRAATYELDAAYTVPLKDFGTGLNFAAKLGTYFGTDEVKGSNPNTRAWGNYWLAGVTLPFQINKPSVLSIGWAYTDGSDSYFKQSGSARQKIQR